jgi:hypothetical protein
MMDFMMYFSVAHPKNFARFIEIFSSNLLNDMPNPFTPLFDDNCGEVGEKFEDQDLTC